MANYPWDGSDDRGTHYSKCPDDAAYAHLARVYAGAHARMHTNNKEFAQGVTNGAAWYPLWGGMQVRAAPALAAPGEGFVGDYKVHQGFALLELCLLWSGGPVMAVGKGGWVAARCHVIATC